MGSGSGDDGRYSQTNVQVAGVDEADIVKTDGKFIYYTPGLYYPENITLIEDAKYSYYNYNSTQKTYVIDALPPETAYIISSISDAGGRLYLAENLLIAIDYQTLTAYDISNPSAPKKVWEQTFDGYYVDSRMIDGQLYLVTQEYRSVYPLVYNGKVIAPQDCYYPYGPGVIQPNTDITYFISSVNVKTGSFEKTIALIGSYSTILYASENNLYLTNYYYPNTTRIELDFILDHGSNYLPASVMRNIRQIMTYGELSDYIKYMAVQENIYEYMATLSGTDAQNFYTRFYEDYNAYSAPIIEDGERTTITKIDLMTFSVESGFVYGRINNQFALDEYNGYLRVAATSGNNWRNEARPQTSSVYVFNADMNVVGRLTGLAPREDIMSSRYVGDRLYLVTFEQIDPFFVIDLSNPENPTVLGELKIPGYSTYLHPLNDTLVIGVGYTGDWRSWGSKLSLFDVSDVKNPIELDTYTIDQYISMYDHHAFLWDADKNLMVIPGYEHAYIFEVKNNKITLIKDDYHKDSYVQRSIYINDYLYIFSTSAIHVYDQNTWQRVNVIPIPQPVYPDYPYPDYPVPLPSPRVIVD
jgi:inhibitor of cysteine peptidase